MSKIVGVMLPLPFNDVFDYRASDDVKIGDVVRVPFGKSIEIGVVFKSEKISDLDEKKIKNILGVLPYCLKPSLLKFVEWVAKYNLAYIGLVLKMVLCAKGAFDDPKMHILYKLTGKTLQEAKLKNSDARWHVIDLLKHAPYSKAEIMTGAGVSAGVIKTLIDAGILEPVSVQRPKEKQNLCFQGIEVQLTEEQQNAADYLIKAQETGFNVTLIDGVTGSGKTEVYLQAAVNVLKKGKQVLILVPEIALTTQWLERFEKRFGVKPYQWHSALTSAFENCLAFIFPFPSIGSPNALTTRPKSSKPTGTFTILPVRLTTSPSLMLSSEPKITTATLSSSKFSAIPFTPD